MADILSLFKQKAEDLVSAMNSKGGLRATIESLRRQMAEADRRRAMGRARAELKRLNRQIEEMVTAVGVQAVGLYAEGKLQSPDLQPLCQHIVELKADLAQQEAELAKLEAVAEGQGRVCAACKHPLLADGAFCPHCGAPIGAPAHCVHCGAALRQGARFCSRCGKTISTPDP